MEKKLVVNEVTNDTDLVNIQAMRKTRRKMKVLATLEAQNAPEWLEDMVDRAYEAMMLNRGRKMQL